MNRTKVDWADYSWNPVVGCTGACPYCYARKMAHRFHRDFMPHFVERNFNRAMPKKLSRIFVNSMSDLADWTGEWYCKVGHRIMENPQHLFLFLSKRPWECEWQGPDNAMLGYTATNQGDIDNMLDHGVITDFVSIEPLHGPITGWPALDFKWIIVGAETGNRKGKVTPEPGWIEDIYKYATDNNIPLFFKESLKPHWPFDGYDYFPQEYPELDK
jgi:protein gp37